MCMLHSYVLAALLVSAKIPDEKQLRQRSVYFGYYSRV